MNERMLQLAIHAGLKKPHASDREYIGDFDWRKFGDLIIRECLEQVRDEVQYECDWELADSVTKRVMEHFGVEL